MKKSPHYFDGEMKACKSFHLKIYILTESDSLRDRKLIVCYTNIGQDSLDFLHVLQ